jgi:hypothetical protein
MTTTMPKVMTGFCNVGSCEGTRPKGILSGTPMKTCPMWMTCSCTCHEQITKMFEMTGRERIEVPNPEYVPYQRDFWMPSFEDRLPEPTPDVPTEDTLQVTATGRVRKGGLEAAVQRVVLSWSERVPAEREDCTVAFLSEQIYKAERDTLEKPPSLGAVAAVLDRWTKYGYALIGHKPVRVIGLTPEGKEKGLDWCRARFKAKGK